MKILTLNCNGIRSALSKGLLDIIRNENPDMIAFQETKAPETEIRKSFWKDLGYEAFVCLAEKPGYSGVCTFTKIKPLKTTIGYGSGIFLSEGRSILLEFSNFYFWNLYFPSGTTGEIRQKVKYEFLDEVTRLTAALQKKKKPLVLVGDVNIAHTERDIHNPKANVKNSGFLPEERKWMSDYFQGGLVDLYRYLHPDKIDSYSWWTYRAGARAKNKGWRIDYILGSEALKNAAETAKIISEPVVSDHAAVVVELQIS
ncbi:exodeoxyribonuclease III [Leptospira ognonensis]|uniref:Exodeoxyribonuclease III n=1 Tax=Leptospira ognonensis TaxID=2484945 RepID=A0A4R9KDG8_9LEPT|nr:exodeoxyribonuclease III [Leptospira ognonensis]TGL63985.1 exodeoxyribonuclease III [Leptospira ognonensis]